MLEYIPCGYLVYVTELTSWTQWIRKISQRSGYRVSWGVLGGSGGNPLETYDYNIIMLAFWGCSMSDKERCQSGCEKHQNKRFALTY